MPKILITGASGFIGSHLVELCVQQGYDVRVFIRYNSKNNWGWLEHIPIQKSYEVVTGDIRDYDSVDSALEGCSAVFHLAALIGIPYSYRSPQAYIQTNIVGTYNILHASLKHELQDVIITSTSETYGSAQYVPMDEKHPLVGQSPYSATKIAADQLGISYFKSFNLPVKIVRPFNTYGPRQSARAVIPTIISQIFNGSKRIKLGNVAPTRDWTFVKDTVAGFVEILQSKSLYGEVTNIGMNEEISIGDLVRKIEILLSVDIEVQSDEQRRRPQNSEVGQLRCDNSKILSHTSWKPQYSLVTGLGETIAFVKDNLALYKSELYNV
jgi:NAD dependent epimerase/dehydratase